MSGLAEQSTQANRYQDTDNPKGRSGPEMGDVISRLEALTDESGENGTYRTRNGETEAAGCQNKSSNGYDPFSTCSIKSHTCDKVRNRVGIVVSANDCAYADCCRSERSG
jgi:hypothetical protein